MTIFRSERTHVSYKDRVVSPVLVGEVKIFTLGGAVVRGGKVWLVGPPPGAETVPGRGSSRLWISVRGITLGSSSVLTERGWTLIVQPT